MWKYNISSAIYAQDKFVAACAGGQMIYSQDGQRWREGRINIYGHHFIWAVTFGAGKFYAARSYANKAYTLVSSDGVSWKATKASLANDSDTYPNFMSMAWGEAK